jgi:hypothetical protein
MRFILKCGLVAPCLICAQKLPGDPAEASLLVVKGRAVSRGCTQLQSRWQNVRLKKRGEKKNYALETETVYR